MNNLYNKIPSNILINILRNILYLINLGNEIVPLVLVGEFLKEIGNIFKDEININHKNYSKLLFNTKVHEIEVLENDLFQIKYKVNVVVHEEIIDKEFSLFCRKIVLATGKYFLNVL